MPRAPPLKADDRPGGSLVAGAWRVHVNRGTEQAILRDLEYFVARELEQQDGYAGIDPRLSIAIARRTIAAHQARRVIPTRARYRVLPTAPVAFESAHETYLEMITLKRASAALAPPRDVTVAILDSTFDPQHLAPGVEVASCTSSRERAFRSFHITA